jgi:serine/threonine protein phosphatase PrpC
MTETQHTETDCPLIPKSSRPDWFRPPQQTGIRESEHLTSLPGVLATEASKDHQGENQDAGWVGPDSAGVIDGVGTSMFPTAAAQAGMESLRFSCDEIPSGADPEQVRTKLLRAITKATIDVSLAVLNGQATAVLAKLVRHEGKRLAIFANVGDSRGYIWRGQEGQLRQVTVDHDLTYTFFKSVQAKDKEMQEGILWLIEGQLKAVGEEDLIQDTQDLLLQLAVTKEGLLEIEDHLAEMSSFSSPSSSQSTSRDRGYEGLFHLRNIVMQGLGQGDLHPFTTVQELQPDDAVYLFSDGITDCFTHTQLSEYIREAHEKGMDREQIAQFLIKKANEVKKSDIHFKQDDKTVVILG